MAHGLGRAWHSVVGDDDADPVYVDDASAGSATGLPEAIEKVMHQTVIKVTSDIENMSFNTAISQLMIFNNELLKSADRYRESCEVFALLLQPFAPHLAEEMWQVLGHKESMAYAPWPKADASKAEESSVEVVFQVNGKVRAKAQVAKDMDKAALEKLALDNDRVKEFMACKTVVKSIVVPGKLVNIVVK